MENIFYFRIISAIGGTEQFLYEIAKKYSDLDITVFYDSADPLQLRRLKKYVRCRKRTPGEKIKCRYAFFNFNIDMINDVEAERYYFIAHANYEALGYKPPIEHPKLTHFIGVSDFSRRKLDEYGELLGMKIKTELCYNPLTIEEPKKVIRLISATRLDDKVKGGQRTLTLINALDEYARKNDRQYLWLIFTNQTQLRINSTNVCLMERRIDIRPYIADSDYLVQLSNDMETYCYSINEALSYGVPVVTTPLSVMKELPVTKDMYIECEWNMSNARDVAREIFERKPKKFTYTPPADRWREILSDKPSDYSVSETNVRVRATDAWERNNIQDKDTLIVPESGSEWTVSEERYDELRLYEARNGVHLIDKI